MLRWWRTSDERNYMSWTPERKQKIIRELRQDDGMREQFGSQIDALADMIEGAGIENLHPALVPWIRETAMGPFIKHPFCYMTLGPDALFVKNANQFYEAKIRIRREYLDEGNWHGYLYAHERPWRMHALARLWEREKISSEQFPELLADMWRDTEMPQANLDEPLQLFREAGFTTDDPEGWEKLPDEITLYRGVDGDFELTADGPSWTMNIETAKVFAYRYGAKGAVYRYVARKDEALAYLTGRDEAEIILDFYVGGFTDSDSNLIELEEGNDLFR